MRFLNPGSFGIVLLCFFLPFINIKCNGVQLASLSGVQMATGANINAGDSGMFGKKTSASDLKRMQSVPLLVTMFILLAAGITVLVMTIRKPNERIVRKATITGHGMVLLLLLIEIFRLEYVVIKAPHSSGFGPVSISWGLDIGYWVALLVPLGIIIYNFRVLRKPVVILAIKPEHVVPPNS